MFKFLKNLNIFANLDICERFFTPIYLLLASLNTSIFLLNNLFNLEICHGGVELAQILRPTIFFVITIQFDKISSELPLIFEMIRIFGRFVCFGAKILMIGQHLVDIVERHLSISMNLLKPIESSIINDQNYIKLTLFTDLHTLFNKILGPSVFGVAQLVAVFNFLKHTFCSTAFLLYLSVYNHRRNCRITFYSFVHFRIYINKLIIASPLSLKSFKYLRN